MVNIDVTGMGENISLSRDVRTEDLEKDVTRGRESADKGRRKGSMFRLIILFLDLKRLRGHLEGRSSSGCKRLPECFFLRLCSP